MEWQQIVGFYYAARLGSFTKAGEATLRTQSALSQQIKALENELGSPLFERIGKRKIKLTPSGERFFGFAESVLESYENLKVDLSKLSGVRKGPLKISAPFTTLYHLIPDKLRDYMERFPEVELTLLDRPQERVVELVRSGEVDFGLALESVVPKDLATIRWVRVETVLLVPQGHPLADLKRVTWKQLAKYPLILQPKSGKNSSRALIEEQFRKLGFDHRVVMASSNIELSSIYVEMGLEITFANVVKELPALKMRKLTLISLDHYFKPDHLCVAMRKNKILASYKGAFLDVLFGKET